MLHDKKSILIFILWCISPCLVWGKMVSPCQVSLSIEQEKQWRTLIYKVRCPMCEGQVVAESSAPLAQKIQCFLADGLREGKSPDLLLQMLKERFGSDIKEVDNIELQTFFLWIVPVFFLGGICFFIFHTIRKIIP